MRKSRRSKGPMLPFLAVLVALSGMIPIVTTAMPGNVVGHEPRAMTFSNVTFAILEPEGGQLPPGSTASLFAFAAGTPTPGVQNSVRLEITDPSNELTFRDLDCDGCTTLETSPLAATYSVDGAASNYTERFYLGATVPTNAQVGDTYNLLLTATESPSGLQQTTSVTLTVIAPPTPTPTPSPTLAATATSPAATATQSIDPPATTVPGATNTPVPATQTPGGPTATVVPPNPTATVTSPPDDGVANVRIRVTSRAPAEANTLPAGSFLQVRQGNTNAYSVNIGQAGGSPFQLPLGPTSLNTSGEPADFDYGTYTVTLDAGAAYEPFAQDFTFNSPIETLEIVLTPDLGDGESLVDIAITSSDPAVANRMGDGTTIVLTQGSRVEFSGTLTDPATYPLPRTLSFSDPIQFGVYTLTIDAGANFDVYTAQIVIEQAPEQIVNVVLQVDGSGGIVEALIAKLKEILAEILAGR